MRSRRTPTPGPRGVVLMLFLSLAVCAVVFWGWPRWTAWLFGLLAGLVFIRQMWREARMDHSRDESDSTDGTREQGNP